ncbi:60S ribosomal protein L15-like protein [Cricetulus griseus]|nr:60S ribosomal protein L15-like protein [Cricetulus griseus]
MGEILNILLLDKTAKTVLAYVLMGMLAGFVNLVVFESLICSSISAWKKPITIIMYMDYELLYLPHLLYILPYRFVGISVEAVAIRGAKMGAYKYMQQLGRKKQSKVMRFLLRVCFWQYRRLSVLHRALSHTGPDKVQRLGYKAKQGYVIYRIRVCRGGRKCPVPKGATHGKPVHHGVNQLKFARSLQSVAEERVGCHCGALRVLNSYWNGEDSTYKCFEVILIDPFHKAIRRNPDTQTSPQAQRDAWVDIYWRILGEYP